MTECIIQLRNRQYRGNVTDEDALFFASLFYDSEEQAMEREGRGMDAYLHMAERFAREANTIKKANKDEQSQELTPTQIIAANVGMQVQLKISKDFALRKITAQRLLECFPDIDSQLVYVRDEGRFGLRLEIAELMSVIDNVMRIAFANLSQKEIQSMAPKLESFQQLTPEIQLSDGEPKESEQGWTDEDDIALQEAEEKLRELAKKKKQKIS